jgi:hypothetical protein
MNFGIVISYVIAAFLTITIITITYTVGFSNQEVTTTLMKKNHSQAIQQILINDVPKIGFKNMGIVEDMFITATTKKISFKADLDNDGDVEVIIWEYKPDKAPEHAKNPHVDTVTRTVDGVETDITVGITNFVIRYYDTYGSSTPMSTPISSSDYEDIVQIEFEMELQSDFSLNYRASDDDNYVTTSWRKRFSPVNLRPN